MPKSTLTWYKSKAKKLIREFRLTPQRELAATVNVSQQVMSYRLKNVYPKALEDLIRLLDISGYEIVEKDAE